MFKKRLITALLLVPTVLAIISLKSTMLIQAIVLFLTLLCAREWANLIPLKQLSRIRLFILTVGIIAVASVYLTKAVLAAAIVIWIINIIAIVRFPQSQRWWGNPWCVLTAGYVLLAAFYASVVNIYQHKQGQQMLIYILFIVWAADIGAYISGRLIGRHKLIVNVSPGKTLEGALGGLVLALVVALFTMKFFHWPIWSGLRLTAFLVVISIFGDLFVSMLKRRSGLKDTGNLLPGHGGILDRLDSLIAVVPFYCIAINHGLIG